MLLFENEDEKMRKQRLKDLEDKRLRFVENLKRKGLMPERMLLCSDEVGAFTAIARAGGGLAVIKGATFGGEDDFTIEIQNPPRYTREEIAEKGSGLNGMFGFGRKPARGFTLRFELQDGSTADFCFIAGRTSFMECRNAAKNPLLSLKRRRADGNVVWEFKPIDGKDVDMAERALEEHYLK